MTVITQEWVCKNSSSIIAIWRFPKMEVPPVIIYFNGCFPPKPSVLGYPHLWKHQLSSIIIHYHPLLPIVNHRLTIIKHRLTIINHRLTMENPMVKDFIKPTSRGSRIRTRKGKWPGKMGAVHQGEVSPWGMVYHGKSEQQSMITRGKRLGFATWFLEWEHSL